MDNSPKTYRRILFCSSFIESLLIIVLCFLVHRHQVELYELLHPSSQFTVYTTIYGTHYHALGCGALWNSSCPVTLRQAVLAGYMDCERCETPAYVDEYDPIDTWDEYTNSGYASEFVEAHPVLISLAIINLVLFMPAVIVISHYHGAHSSDQKHNAEPPQATASPQEPPSDVPVSVTLKTCRLIWLSTYHVARHSGVTNNATLTGHIWATLFYISTKHIRNQETVDEIYSWFDSAASFVNDGKTYPSTILSPIRFGYKDLAPTLNRSGIDPRNESGITALWHLLSQSLFKYRAQHPSAFKAFREYADILISDAAQYSK